MNNIFWTAISNNERYTEIERLKNVINRHGDTVDHKFFSDLSISFTIEIEENKIVNLYNDLKEILVLDKFDYLDTTSHRERIIFLNITFIKGQGNLSIETPIVPG